jgi:hypothetical protein
MWLSEITIRHRQADKVRFTSSQGIRDEIGKTVPLYAGIERVSKEGENFQWGGPRLFAEGEFATPDGKAHFSVVSPKERRAPKGMFYVSTRRGKQFNSMVQRATDPLTARRATTSSFQERIHNSSVLRTGNIFASFQLSEPTLAASRSTRLSWATSKFTG